MRGMRLICLIRWGAKGEGVGRLIGKGKWVEGIGTG